MTRPSTAVIVCAYTLERWQDLSDSLVSASAQLSEGDELWLVVDHNDELLARAESDLTSALPVLRVVQNNRTRGLSGARNTALEHATADVVVFLDDDASAESGWLPALLRPYDDESVIASGGSATPVWTTRGGRPVTLPAADAAWGELDWVVGCSYRGQPVVASPVRNLMGCNMSFRRSVFAALGGFSENLGRVGKTPLGGEETELCIRAQAAFPQSKIVFEPSSVVRHRVSPDRRTWRYLLRRGWGEGVSKAAVSELVGRDRALASETSYVAHVLPTAFLRELRAALGPHGVDVRRLQGAVAIVAALTATAAGYARGWSVLHAGRHSSRPSLRDAPSLKLVDA